MSHTDTDTETTRNIPSTSPIKHDISIFDHVSHTHTHTHTHTQSVTYHKKYTFNISNKTYYHIWWYLTQTHTDITRSIPLTSPTNMVLPYLIMSQTHTRTCSTANIPLIQRFLAHQHRRDDWNGRFPLRCSVLEDHLPSLSEHPFDRGKKSQYRQDVKYLVL